MKRKLLILLLALTAVITGAFGLAACGGDDNNPSPVEAGAYVTFKCDFEDKDYITKFRLVFADVGVMDYDPVNTWHEDNWDGTVNLYAWGYSYSREDAKFTISLKNGYDPDTLGIVEKDDKPFTKQSTTVQGTDHITVTIPFAENIDYNFTFTAPEPYTDEVGFRVADSRDLENITDPVLVNFLSNTQVWVENAVEEGEGETYSATPGFVDITADDPSNPGDKVFTLSQHSIKVDLSKSKFPVYVRFDKANPGKNIYNDESKNLFRFGDYGSTYSSTEYTKIPGTDEYAYAIYFNITDFNLLAENETPVFYLNWSYLTNYLGYRSGDTISKTFSVKTIDDNDRGIKYAYNFNLVSYQIGSEQEITSIPNSVTKEYGKAYTLKYHFEGVDADNWSYSGETPLAQALADSTNFANIKLTVNGEVISTYYDSATQIYSFTIGATKTPYDYNESFDTLFAVSADSTSINAIEGPNTLIINTPVAAGAPQDSFSSYSFIFNRQIVGNEMKSVYITAEHKLFYYSFDAIKFGKFKLKLTLNGTQLEEKVYTPGVDYNIPVTDKTGYPGLENAKVVYNTPSTDEYYDFILGTYDDTFDASQNSYVILCFNEYGTLGITANDKGNTTDKTTFKVEIEVIEPYSKAIDLEITGSAYGGSFTVNGAQATTVGLDGEKEIEITLGNYDSGNEMLDVVYELYSNGVLIASSEYFGDYECRVDGYLGSGSYVSHFLFNSGSSGYSGGSDMITLTPFNISTDIFNLRYIGGVEGAEDYASVVIDKIVVKVNTRSF